jgi:hypothetical protein
MMSTFSSFFLLAEAEVVAARHDGGVGRERVDHENLRMDNGVADLVGSPCA